MHGTQEAKFKESHFTDESLRLTEVNSLTPGTELGRGRGFSRPSVGLTMT